MPGRVLLDTNIIIAFFSGEKAVSQRFADSEVVVPCTVLGELYYRNVLTTLSPQFTAHNKN